jgi:hypothetical protein
VKGKCVSIVEPRSRSNCTAHDDDDALRAGFLDNGLWINSKQMIPRESSFETTNKLVLEKIGPTFSLD